MAIFKVLAGKHVTGAGDKKKIYSTGQLIESDEDLTIKFKNKFQLVGGTIGQRTEAYPSQFAAPGGQVVEGFQISEGGPPPTPDENVQIKAETTDEALRLAAGMTKEAWAKKKKDEEDHDNEQKELQRKSAQEAHNPKPVVPMREQPKKK